VSGAKQLSTSDTGSVRKQAVVIISFIIINIISVSAKGAPASHHQNTPIYSALAFPLPVLLTLRTQVEAICMKVAGHERERGVA
jgi:hypothetical protein